MSETLSTQTIGSQLDIPARPALQRRELGPIMHAWGSEIYEALNRSTALDATLPGTITFDDIADFAGDQRGCLTEIIRRSVRMERFAAATELQGWLDDHKRLEHQISELDTAEKLLEESVITGVMFPLNAAVFLADREKKDYSLSVPTSSFVDTLRDSSFQSTVLSFAHGPSGFIGISLSGRVVRDYDHWPKKWGEVIVQNSEGQYEPAAAVRADSNEYLAAVHENGAWALQSGGCPVRHKGFPIISDFAKEFLSKHNFEIPAASEPSLIEKGIDVTATMIERAVK